MQRIMVDLPDPVIDPRSDVACAEHFINNTDKWCATQYFAQFTQEHVEYGGAALAPPFFFT
jgi:hypothetical protein